MDAAIFLTKWMLHAMFYSAKISYEKNAVKMSGMQNPANWFSFRQEVRTGAGRENVRGNI